MTAWRPVVGMWVKSLVTGGRLFLVKDITRLDTVWDPMELWLANSQWIAKDEQMHEHRVYLAELAPLPGHDAPPQA